MAVFRVGTPSGRVLRIEADTYEDALRGAEEWDAANGNAQQAPTQPAAPPAEPTGALAAARNAAFEQGPPAPAPSALDRTGRALKLGVQNVGDGIANTVGMPIDLLSAAGNLATLGANKALGTSVPPIENPAMGSQHLKGLARSLMGSVGMEPVPEAEMSPFERYAGKAIDFGTQNALTGGMLAAAAPVRAASVKAAGDAAKAGGQAVLPGSVPRATDRLLAPYTGENVGRTLAGDVAVGAGAGVGTEAARSLMGDGVIAELVGALGGGMAAGAATTAAGHVGNIAKRAFDSFTGKGVDQELFRATGGSLRASPAESLDAAKLLQGEIANAGGDPAASLGRLTANRSELQGAGMQALPTPAALAEDAAMMAREKAARNSNPAKFINMDRAQQSGLRDMMDGTVSPNADDARFTAEMAAQRAAQEQASAASVQAAIAREEAARAQNVAQAAPVQAAADTRGQASQNLDKAIVQREYIPWRDEKNAAFNQLDPDRNIPVDSEALTNAAQGVRQRANELVNPSEQMPTEFMRRVEALAPDLRLEQSPLLDQFGRNIQREVNDGGNGTAALGDVVDVRKYLNTAQQRAKQAGNFDLANAIGDLKRTANRTIEQHPAAAQANDIYREGAAAFRGGPGDPMGNFTKAIDRDKSRSTTPPSATGDTFLRPGEPEAAASLNRVLARAADPTEANTAVRQFFLADMASTLDTKSGTLRADALRAWRQKWGQTLDQFPAVKAEVDDWLSKAQQGELLTGKAANDVKAASEAAKRDADDISRGALGLATDADPDRIVQSALNRNDAGKVFDDLLSRTANNPEARDGLKKLVQKHLVDSVTNPAPQKTAAGDTRNPVSFAKLDSLLTDHGDILAKLYTPQEMNSLRAIHKAMGLKNLEAVNARTGSNTASDTTMRAALNGPFGAALRTGFRGLFGAFKGGTNYSMLRDSLALIPSARGTAEKIVAEALTNPDVAAHLLGRKIMEQAPPWANWTLYTTAADRAITDKD